MCVTTMALKIMSFLLANFMHGSQNQALAERYVLFFVIRCCQAESFLKVDIFAELHGEYSLYKWCSPAVEKTGNPIAKHFPSKNTAGFNTISSICAFVKER